MIIRIVKMEFRSDETENFRKLFEERKQTIRAFEGCLHLELWKDKNQKEIFFTYSHWESEAHLDHYRYSAFFRDTCEKTRALFANKAKAWSVDCISKA